MRRWLFLWLVLVLAVAPAVRGQGQYPSRGDTFINDYAGLLTSTDVAAVRTLLSDLKSTHGIETVVVTIGSINDYETGATTIESFATGLFNTWGIGDAARNDGVLLLVAAKDRKVRVELGSGYGSGPSSEMQAVIDRYLVPKFRAAEYSSGILLGTRAMIAKLTDQPMPEIDDLPSTAPNYSSPATETTDSSGLMALLLVIGVGAGVYVVIKALNGEGSSTYEDGDDNRRSWSDDRPRSSWRSSSSSRSNSSSRSSSSSRRSGGGRSSGGGASGSW